MVEHGNTLSRNPNLCASCSSLADGMDDSGLSTLARARSGARLDTGHTAPASQETDPELFLPWVPSDAPGKPLHTP